MPDWIAHFISTGIGLISAVIALYVSYRMMQQREWFQKEMTRIVRDNCAGRVEFDAHVKADDLFQHNLMEEISERRAESSKQHTDHYEHESRTDIHQQSMSGALLESKFENVKAQVATVGQRVDFLTSLVENALKRSR